MNISAYTDRLVGRRVQVNGPGHYDGTLEGCTGVIRAVWSGVNVAVAIDGKRNSNSAKGYFYFKASDLEVLNTEIIKTAEAAEKGESSMQKMSNYVNVAVVQFLNGKPFQTFEYANYEPDLAVGDVCAVMSAHHGMGLAEVVEIKDLADGELCREIVAKVDTSRYDQRVEQRAKAAELKAKMQERAKQLQDIVLYQTLAKDDPEMAQMLQDYLALNK